MRGPGPPNTVREWLRQETDAAHRQLDGALGLMDETLDQAAYLAILTRLYGFWRTWQPQASALMDDDAFTVPRRRVALLAADLSALGLSAAEIESLPVCPPLPLRTEREALGSFYVLEGATLGGQVIRRHVERKLGLAASGCAYFSGYGPRTGEMWRDTLARLETVPPGDVDQLVRGATVTFAGIARWLRPPD